MTPSSFRSISKVLVLASLAIACGRDRVTAPEAVTLLDSGQNARHAALEQEIAGLTAQLEPGGGLDQLLGNGVDEELISARRERANVRLDELLRRRAVLQSTGSSNAALVQEIEAADAPGCISLTTLQADDCFLDWYTTIDHKGTGSVYQLTQFYWTHATQTQVTDNGASLGTRTTSSFGAQPSWAAPFRFLPSDPNCLHESHTIVGTTTHDIRIGIKTYGVVLGQESSRGTSTCARKYLTVSLSPSSINVGQTSSITVGNLPQGCAYGVTSSNADIATILNPGGNIFAAIGLSAGSVTINARCSGQGAYGSATLTVNGVDPEERVDETPCGTQLVYDAESCESGGGFDYDGDGNSGGSEASCQYFLMQPQRSYDGGVTWHDYGQPWIEERCNY